VFALGVWAACSGESARDEPVSSSAGSSGGTDTSALTPTAPPADTDDPAPGPAAPSQPAATEGAPVPTRPVVGKAPDETSVEAPEPVAADAGGPSGVAPPACARELTEANIALVAAAIDELFVQGDISAVDRYWGEPYLQHNPQATSGVQTFRNLFGGLISPGNSIYSLSRIIGQCELVLIHGNYTSFGGPTYDMFRVEDARIVEHWDAAAIGAGPNASGHTALDGPSAVGDVQLTAQNEALVLRFVDAVLIPRAFDSVADYVSADLIEHNPDSSDGLAAYIAYQQSQALAYRQVHHSIADGDFVFVLSEGSVAGADVAHYDLFRVAGEQIVEHWDGRRAVPQTTASGLGIF